MKRHLCAIVLTFVLAVVCRGEVVQSNLEIRVSVDVKDKSPNRATIKSLVTRKLRSLPNVIVVDDRQSYRVSILSQKASGPAVIAISTICLQAFGHDLFLSSLREEKKADMAQFASYIFFYPSHQLLITPEDRLENACDIIVNSLDTEIFEVERQNFQKLMEGK